MDTKFCCELKCNIFNPIRVLNIIMFYFSELLRYTISIRSGDIRFVINKNIKLGNE